MTLVEKIKAFITNYSSVSLKLTVANVFLFYNKLRLITLYINHSELNRVLFHKKSLQNLEY